MAIAIRIANIKCVDFRQKYAYHSLIMTRKNVKLLEQKTVFTGYHRLEVCHFQPKSLHGEAWLEPMSREIFRAGAVASTLLYCPESDEILLNEQFRAGAYMAGALNPWLFECCAGGIDDGETPEQAARREAMEETGSEILELLPIGTAYTSPGCFDEQFYLFCGRIARPDAGKIHGLIEEGEEIKTHLMPFSDVIALLDEGKITNVTTALCLHWLARNRDKLRAQWLDKGAA